MLTTWSVEDGACRVREGAISDLTAALPVPEARAAARARLTRPARRRPRCAR